VDAGFVMPGDPQAAVRADRDVIRVAGACEHGIELRDRDRLSLRGPRKQPCRAENADHGYVPSGPPGYLAQRPLRSTSCPLGATARGSIDDLPVLARWHRFSHP